MKDKLTILFLCLLVLGMAQDDMCQELRLAKIQTGEIILNPNDLGTAGSNKNYYEPLTRGKFDKNDWLGTAVALAGFETNCGQSHYSLIVDIAEPQSENTKLKLVIDFRNQAKDSMTTWTKVKLTYLVASAQRNPTGVTSAYIWATSQLIDVIDKFGALNLNYAFNDPIFGTTGTAANDNDGCGLYYDQITNPAAPRWRFGIECAVAGAADKDVAIHAYIMGFQYQPDAASSGYYIGANVRFNSANLLKNKKEVAFVSTDVAGTAPARTTGDYPIDFKFAATNNGPQLQVEHWNNELKTVKVALVLTVINPVTSALDNGFDSTTLSYSYSGLYSDIIPASKYNIKTIIDKTDGNSFFNLQEKLPAVKYAIYGLNSFALKDASGCSSFSMDLSIDTVNSYTITVNQAAYVEKVAFEADIYFRPIQSVCSPNVVFTDLYIQAITPVTVAPFTPQTIQAGGQSAQMVNAKSSTPYGNLKWIKTRISEKYETIPSDNSLQWVGQNGDNPLDLQFITKSKTGDTSYIKFNAQVVMNGLTSGKSYGVHLAFVPHHTQYTHATTTYNFQTPLNSGKYSFSVSVNGFNIWNKDYTKAEIDDVAKKINHPDLVQDWIGLNVVGNTAKFVYNVTVPRDNRTDTDTATYQIFINLFEFAQVYDPVTSCCVGSCPAQAGLDVQVTPVACIACDLSKGLAYNPLISSCACADGFYLNENLGFQCFPCETKLCSVCNPKKPGACTTCLPGATLNVLDNTCACSTGFYENSGTCIKCDAKCSSCKVAASCDTCSDSNRDINNNCNCIAGFYDAGVDKCVACNPSCATCSSSSACVSCDARKFRTIKDNICVCQDGYFELAFENGTKICTKCSSECKTCVESAIQCSSCDSSINRVEGYDSLGHRTCICKAGYHALADGACVQSNCKSDKYCSQCEADLALCIQCQASVNRVIKLPEHICVCADGFFEDKDGTCKPCSEGCSKCSSATKCDACVAQATNNGDGTCKCAPGTFFGVSANNVRYCQQCIQYCDKCGNSLTCQACKSGFALSADNTCICPKNNYINPKGECVPCKAGCETCFLATTCEKCIAPLVVEENNCVAKCSPGYYLSGAKCLGCPANCLACTSTNQCFYCKDGFFLSGGVCYSACPAGTVPNRDTFQCVPCNSPCKTCTNHPSSCTSCEPGLGYLQITGTEQKCVKECAEGTFPKGNVCEVCDFRCAKCLGAAGNCIACPAGRYLYNAACWDYCPGILQDGKCLNECPAGYFRASDQECKKCSSECKTCSDANGCTTCANDFVSLNGKCVKDCGAGFYVFRGICVACDKSCKSCANNPTQCTACADGFVSSNGRCISSCQTGTFLDSVSRSCRPCSASCKTCSSEQYCLTCPNDKILPVGGQCLSCVYPCNTCSADLATCYTCQSGFYLSNNDCVRSCPGGTRPVNNVCTCSSGLFLDGTCVSSCPSGYTKVGTDCRRCDSPCTECQGSSTFCTDCLDSYTLRPSTGKCEQSSACNYGQVEDNGKCSRICDSNSYYQNGACIFGGCPDGFKDNGFGGCVSAVVATGRCESPTFKLNGACVDKCGNGFFPSTNTRTCEACSTNCQNCLSRDYCLACSNGFAAVDGKCVAQSSCSGTQVSYNGACVASCPSGTVTSNGRCVRSCPSGSFYFGGWCYDTCPTEAKLFTDNACVATCPAGTSNVDGVCATIV